MCSSLTMNTDCNDNNDIAPGATRRVLMDENNEPQLATGHEHVFVGHMCDCVICQAAQGPDEKNFTEHTGASLASKLQKFDK